jgi:glucose/arabinose dehydrogenase
MARPHVTAVTTLLATALLVPLLAACGDDEPADLPPTVPPSSTATAGGSGTTPTTPSQYPTRVPDVSVARTVATKLEIPWGIAFLPDGSALVAERDTAEIRRVATDGTTSRVDEVAGVEANGEAGLLGLVVPPANLTGGTPMVYAYFTAASDNRIVRMPYDNGRLGEPDTVLTGIPKAGNHDGGRMVIGPDGKLWVGTGEAGNPPLAQQLDSLGGKILRLNLDGSVPADNPFRGSPVWTLGHRNVQGLAFDSRGQLWATEFGQNTWDELNRIERGRNYGWPAVEGKGTEGGRYVEPFIVWSTDEASPSGLAIVDDVAYVAGLRGQRLWQVPLGDAGAAEARFTERYGRLRTVLQAPSGALWVSTSNLDGRLRGRDPAPDDDKILELKVG